MQTAAHDRPAVWLSSRPAGYGDSRTVGGEVRGGSLGRQFVQLKAELEKPSRLAHHLDMLERAGKLLPVRGPWRLEFWALTDTPGTRLAVTFRRHGTAAFVERSRARAAVAAVRAAVHGD